MVGCLCNYKLYYTSQRVRPALKHNNLDPYAIIHYKIHFVMINTPIDILTQVKYPKLWKYGGKFTVLP